MARPLFVRGAVALAALTLAGAAQAAALRIAGANDILREYFDSSLRAARYVLENMGLSEYEASELQKTFFKLDRAAVRDLAQVWIPGVPAEQNPAYVSRTRELNRDLEAALLDRFTETRAERDAADRAAE